MEGKDKAPVGGGRLESERTRLMRRWEKAGGGRGRRERERERERERDAKRTEPVSLTPKATAVIWQRGHFKNHSPPEGKEGGNPEISSRTSFLLLVSTSPTYSGTNYCWGVVYQGGPKADPYQHVNLKERIDCSDVCCHNIATCGEQFLVVVEIFPSQSFMNPLRVRCRPMWADVGRCRPMWADVG